MIHLPCPQCGQFLDVMESQLGKLAECPHCANRFQIPLVPPMPPKAASGVRPSGASVASRKRPAPKVDHDLEEFVEEEKPRPKAKKGKNRRKSSASTVGLDGYTALLLAMVGIMAVFTVVGIFLPLAMLVPAIIGFVISFGAGIWLLVIPFKESALQGLLCMFVPFYALYYLLTHFDEMWKPFVLQLLATLMFGGSLGLLFFLSRIPARG